MLLCLVCKLWGRLKENESILNTKTGIETTLLDNYKNLFPLKSYSGFYDQGRSHLPPIHHSECSQLCIRNYYALKHFMHCAFLNIHLEYPQIIWAIYQRCCSCTQRIPKTVSKTVPSWRDWKSPTNENKTEPQTQLQYTEFPVCLFWKQHLYYGK